MTVPSETNRSGPYSGNGVTTVFGYGFRILNEQHLRVIKRDADGVETVLTLTTNYTVSGVGVAGGGSITLLVAPATGETITILRNIPFTQETDLENQGAYYAETVEDALDAAAMRDQQMQEQLDRAVTIPASEDTAQLDGLVEDILRLADSADNIDTVADNIDAVTEIAPYAEKITENLEDITNFADVYQGPKATDPTTRNDGGALQAGDLYFNTVTKIMRVYDGAAWKDAAAAALNISTKSFVGDGVATTFVLDVSPGTVNNVLVEVGGILQVPTVDFTVAGTTLTIAPAVGVGIEINTWNIATVSTINVPADASVTTQKIFDGAVTGQKIAAAAVDPSKLSSGVAFGQCRLVLDGANLRLKRFNGLLLTINGRHCEIPSAGVSLAPAGSTPLTTYYIYANDDNADGIVDGLEYSATAYAVDSATGVFIKTGDPTRTLVGMARPVPGPAWVDSANQRFVRSWFNRVSPRGASSFTANRTTASSSPVELNSEIRNEFLSWADEVCQGNFSGWGNVSGGGNAILKIVLDADSADLSRVGFATSTSSVLVGSGVFSPSEGYHYLTIYASTSAGTVTVFGTGAAAGLLNSVIM